MRPFRDRFPLPLATWVLSGFGCVGLACLVVVAVLISRNGFTRDEQIAIGAGLVVSLFTIGASAIWIRRVTAGLRELHNDALRRLCEPDLHTERTGPRWRAVNASRELSDLSRVLDALHLRARVVGEVAEQSRRTAEHASAGMFELLSGLVAAEEATRGQLSAELHDTVAQTLITARVELAQASQEHPADEHLTQLSEQIDDAEEQVRAVMARARPPELRSGDLASAVAMLSRELARRYLLEVRVSWPNEPQPLPMVLAVTLYRFFQEALLNVVKHAEVDEAEVSLSTVDGQIVATVHDAGEGFAPTKVQSIAGRHVGLELLRERARLAGGSLEIQSDVGKGTSLILRLPLPNSAVGG